MILEQLEQEMYSLIQENIKSLLKKINECFYEDNIYPQFFDLSFGINFTKFTWNPKTKGLFLKILKKILYEHDWVVLMDSKTDIYILHKRFELFYSHDCFIPTVFFDNDCEVEKNLDYSNLYTLACFSDRGFKDIVHFFKTVSPYDFFPKVLAGE